RAEGDSESPTTSQRKEGWHAALDALEEVMGAEAATPESAEPVAWRVDWVASATNEPKCCYRTNQDAAELVIEELSEAVPPMPATLTALFDRPTPAASDGGLRDDAERGRFLIGLMRFENDSDPESGKFYSTAWLDDPVSAPGSPYYTS